MTIKKKQKVVHENQKEQSKKFVKKKSEKTKDTYTNDEVQTLVNNTSIGGILN